MKVLLRVGADGRGIAEIVKVGTSGVVDTYDIVLSDRTRIPFDVTNGSSIATIEKTATVGLVDTYTITLTNGDTFEFEVTNADGSTAGTVDYDNTSSGLDATNVQDAIDEVNAKADTKTDQSMIATVQPNLTAVQQYLTCEQFVYQGVLYRATTTIANGGTITIGGNCEPALKLTNYKVHEYNFSNAKVSSSYKVLCRKYGRMAIIRFILRATDTIAINEVLATVGEDFYPIDDVYITTYLQDTLFLKTNGQLVNANLASIVTGGYRHCYATYMTAK